MTMSSKSVGFVRVNRWKRKAFDQRRKDCYYEALASSRHNIDLVSDEVNMKPEKLTKTPGNVRVDASTMKMKKLYLESTCEDDDSHFPSSSRVSDALTGTNRTPYHVREPIEND